MKSASNTLPETPRNDVTAGIDWARDDHAVCIVDGRGHQIARTAAGLRDLVAFLGQHGVGEVAIERPDGPVIDTLLGAELTVVVISPNQAKNLRSRYGSAGNKDDRFDAFVLADTLRAHLRNVLPGAVGLFAELDSQIALAFLTRFTTQDQADWLTPTRLGHWLTKTGYCGRTSPEVLHERLTAAPRGLTGPTATEEAENTRALLALLSTLVAQIKTLAARIDRQLDAHADAHIFTSLPRARPGPGRPPARRDRRLPRQVPHPRVAGLPGRRRALDQTIRQAARRHLRLGLRQTTARRRHRLRRRQPTRQPLGRRPVRPSPSPRPRPPPRRPHPRPRLAVRHLALLAKRHRLRPHPTPRTPTPPRLPNRGGLTQGFSCARF